MMPQDDIDFDLASLSKIVEKLNVDSATDPDRTPVAFLPKEGTFKARFFLDPMQRLFRPIVYYQFGKAKSLVPPPDVDDANRQVVQGNRGLAPETASRQSRVLCCLRDELTDQIFQIKQNEWIFICPRGVG
jgi:hypothetical protein